MRRFFKVSNEDSRAFAVRVYACVLVLLSCALVGGLLLTTGFPTEQSPWPLLAFGLLAIMAERQSVRLHGQHRAICRFPATPVRGGGVWAATRGSDWRDYRPSGLWPPLHAMGHLDGEPHHHRWHGRSRGASATRCSIECWSDTCRDVLGGDRRFRTRPHPERPHSCDSGHRLSSRSCSKPRPRGACRNPAVHIAGRPVSHTATSR